MTAVGFEPTHLSIVELESTPLDHSGKLSLAEGCRRARHLFSTVAPQGGKSLRLPLDLDKQSHPEGCSGSHPSAVAPAERKSTPCGTRTRNLRIRSPTPCPLGQGGFMRSAGHIRDPRCTEAAQRGRRMPHVLTSRTGGSFDTRRNTKRTARAYVHACVRDIRTSVHVYVRLVRASRTCCAYNTYEPCTPHACLPHVCAYAPCVANVPFVNTCVPLWMFGAGPLAGLPRLAATAA